MNRTEVKTKTIGEKRTENLLRDVLLTLKRYCVVICLVSLIFTCGAWIYSRYFVTPQYSTKVSMCVFASQRSGEQITSGELSSDSAIARTCSLLVKSQPVLQAVSEELNGEVAAGAIGGMLTVQIASQMIYVNVTCSDPALAVRVANAILEVAPSVIHDLARAGEMVAVDRAVMPTAPSSPNIRKSVLNGFLLGFVFSCCVIMLVALFDTTVWREEDLERAFHIPVLGRVPAMRSQPQSDAKQSKRRNA